MRHCEAKELALKLMGEHLNDLWRFDWMNSKKAIGQCRQIRGRDYGWIRLSKHMIPAMDEAEVRDTILHEIAHALVGVHHGHDWTWQRKAMEIGCNGERTAKINVANQVRYKYLATCPCCGNVTGMSRKPTREYWCKCSNRTFRPEDKLVWVQQY